MRTKTRLVEHDNLIFYNITGVKVDYDLTGLRLRFDNLFDGVPALGECNKYYRSIWCSINKLRLFRDEFIANLSDKLIKCL